MNILLSVVLNLTWIVVFVVCSSCVDKTITIKSPSSSSSNNVTETTGVGDETILMSCDHYKNYFFTCARYVIINCIHNIINVDGFFCANSESINVNIKSFRGSELVDRDLNTGHRIKSFTLTHSNCLRKIHKSYFECETSLETLNLSNNCLETIDPDMFTDLKKLKTLDLSNNKKLFLENYNFYHWSLASSLKFLNVMNTSVYQDSEAVRSILANRLSTRNNCFLLCATETSGDELFRYVCNESVTTSSTTTTTTTPPRTNIVVDYCAHALIELQINTKSNCSEFYDPIHVDHFEPATCTIHRTMVVVSSGGATSREMTRSREYTFRKRAAVRSNDLPDNNNNNLLSFGTEKDPGTSSRYERSKNLKIYQNDTSLLRDVNNSTINYDGDIVTTTTTTRIKTVTKKNDIDGDNHHQDYYKPVWYDRSFWIFCYIMVLLLILSFMCYTSDICTHRYSDRYEVPQTFTGVYSDLSIVPPYYVSNSFARKQKNVKNQETEC